MKEASPRIVRHAGLIRAGLILLAVPNLVVGAWAFAFTRSFYESFPGFGRIWISPVGPYNAHFTSDTGNLIIAASLLLLYAAYYLERRWVRVSLIVTLVFAVPHFVSHVRLTEPFETFDYVGNLVVVGLSAFVPIVLLALTTRRAGARTA